jgi:hypothetical protein
MLSVVCTRARERSCLTPENVRLPFGITSLNLMCESILSSILRRTFFISPLLAIEEVEWLKLIQFVLVLGR